jgi:hypothetical protein
MRGGLDVLMVTPLSTPEIVLGKWLGGFRHVPFLIILPCLITGTISWREGTWDCPVLIAGYLLIFGALFTSTGLLIATVSARLSRSVTLAAVFYALMTAFWPLLVIFFTRHDPNSEGLLMGSPGLGAILLSVAPVEMRRSGGLDYVGFSLVWTGVLGLVALLELAFTLLSFNYFLGRVSQFVIPALRRNLKEVQAVEKVVG